MKKINIGKFFNDCVHQLRKDYNMTETALRSSYFVNTQGATGVGFYAMVDLELDPVEEGDKRRVDCSVATKWDAAVRLGCAIAESLYGDFFKNYKVTIKKITEYNSSLTNVTAVTVATVHAIAAGLGLTCTLSNDLLKFY